MNDFKSDIAESAEERRLKSDLGRINDALADEHARLVEALAKNESLKSDVKLLNEEVDQATAQLNAWKELARVRGERMKKLWAFWLNADWPGADHREFLEENPEAKDWFNEDGSAK